MKRIILLLLTIILAVPLVVDAKELSIKDVHFNVDDSRWIIITRENVFDNEYIKSVGLDSKKVYEDMLKDDVFVYSIRKEKYMDGSLEFLLTIKKLDNSINNFSNYNNKELEKEAKKIKDKLSAYAYDIYSSNDYNYIVIHNPSQWPRAKMYYTVMNGYGYTFMIRHNTEGITLSYELTDEMNTILDTVTFENNNDFDIHKIFQGIGSIIAIIAIILVVIFLPLEMCGIIGKKRKKKNINNLEGKEDYSDEIVGIQPPTKKKRKKEKKSASFDEYKYDSLLKLKELLDKEVITKEEFEKEKKKIIDE